MPRLDDRIDAYLRNLREGDVFRVLKPGDPDGARLVRRGGRDLINFSSNNYLGLSQDPRLIERANEWTTKWGVGSGASRLVTGTFQVHAALEDKLAKLKGAESALIFTSGFQANSTILHAIFNRRVLKDDLLVFADTLIHASMHHGCRSAGVKPILYRHNDPAHLESLLRKHADKPGVRFILTESVFSMDGDRADLAELCDLADRFDAFLYVDEAHATGVLGPRGMGLAGDVPGRIDLVMGTFSKALGSLGGYAACSQAMKDYLINQCSGFIYSTALPPGVLGAIDAALDIVPGMEIERTRLIKNAEKLRAALRGHGIDTGGSSTQIVPALIGEVAATLAAGRILEDAGLLGIPIRPPTVPKGTSRLRFAVTAEHTGEDMDRLLKAVPEIAKLRRKSA